MAMLSPNKKFHEKTVPDWNLSWEEFCINFNENRDPTKTQKGQAKLLIDR